MQVQKKLDGIRSLIASLVILFDFRSNSFAFHYYVVSTNS